MEQQKSKDIFTNEYIVQDVPPDGNCMFSSLAIALNRTTSSAGEVRKEIVEFIRGHMQEMQNIPLPENSGAVGSVEEVNEDYLQRMSNTGEWGDGVILAAACRLYQRPIHVILDNMKPVVFSSPEFVSKLPLYLGHSSNHYVHLTPRTGTTDGVDAAVRNETSPAAVNQLKRAESASPNRTPAIVIFLVLIGISVTFMLSRYFTASHIQPFPKYAFLWLTIGYEAVAIVFIALMICFAVDRPAYDPDADVNVQPWHKLLRHNMKLFGIVLFFFAIFFFNIFRLFADSQCAGAWNACADDEVRKEHVADLVYTVISTVYLWVVLIFCVRFNAKYFTQTMVLAGLVVVQAANVSLWFNALVDESDAFWLKPNSTVEIQHCLDGINVSNQSNHYVQCFTGTTREYTLLEDVSPYLFPFITEYLMLVTECVMDWFFSGATTSDKSTRPVEQPGNEDLEAARRAPSSPDSSVDEKTPLIGVPASSSLSCGRRIGNAVLSLIAKFRGADYETAPSPTETEEATTSPDISDGRTRRVEQPPIQSKEVKTTPSRNTSASSSTFSRWWYILVNVVLSLIVNFLFIIFGIFNFCCSEDWTTYQHIFLYYKIGYWLLLCLAALVGCFASHSLDRSQSTSPTFFEYFVLLSSAGLIIRSILTIVNSQGDKGVMVAEITHVVHIILQFTFYTYAKPIRTPTTDDGANGQGVESRRRKLDILTGVMSYYVVCNFALWVESSFIETRATENSSEKQYFDNWQLVYSIFNPPSLLFRFNSALLFLEALLDKRR